MIRAILISIFFFVTILPLMSQSNDYAIRVVKKKSDTYTSESKAFPLFLGEGGGDAMARIDTPTRKDTLATPRRQVVGIYWETAIPMYDHSRQSIETKALYLRTTKGLFYRDSCGNDSSMHAYKGLDMTIDYQGSSTHFHASTNHFNPQMTLALRKIKKGSIVTVQLHRKADDGKTKIETLSFQTFHVSGLWWKRLIHPKPSHKRSSNSDVPISA